MAVSRKDSSASRNTRETLGVRSYADTLNAKSREYRCSYAESWIAGRLPYQIRALREARGITQGELARLMGKPQSVVSRLENNHASSVSLRSLWAVAKALDVALLVEFASFGELISRTDDCSPEALARAADTSERLDSPGIDQ